MPLKKPLKIFLVNDNAFCIAMEQQLLFHYGYADISVFTSSSSCFNSLALQPDVILLDVTMESDGMGILKKIKNTNPDIYVVVLSFAEENATAEIALQLGAFDFIIREENPGEKMNKVLLKIEQIQSMLGDNSGSIFKRPGTN